MNRPYIKLDLNGLVITLDHFSSGQRPRIRPKQAEETSATGALNVFGMATELPHLWEFSARVNVTDKDKIEAFYGEAERLKSTFGSYKIILTDCTHPYSERSPRTRGKAPAPYDTETADSPFTGFVKYFATFKVVFSAEPQFTVDGRFDVVTLSFREAEDKTTP